MNRIGSLGLCALFLSCGGGAPDAARLQSLAVANECAYAYGSDGLPTSIRDHAGARLLAATTTGLDAGEHRYRFDALGRTVQKDDLTLGYGPDGVLETARRGADALEYVSDERGRRLYKKKNGAIVMAFLEEGVLTPDELIAPVAVGDTTVGLLRKGAFQLLGVDARGTVFAGSDGRAELASPYGHRGTHPDVAAAIDYATQGFDADLGATRLGLRDYDPAIGRFWTPDPAYLSDPSACVARPYECNLYGYASGNPATFADPTGTESKLLQTLKLTDNARKVISGIEKLGQIVDRTQGFASAVGQSRAPDFVAKGVWAAHDLLSGAASRGQLTAPDWFKLGGAALSGVVYLYDAKERRNVSVGGALLDGGASFGISYWGKDILGRGPSLIDSGISALHAAVTLAYGKDSTQAQLTGVLYSVAPGQVMKYAYTGLIDAGDALVRGDFHQAENLTDLQLGGAYGDSIRGYALGAKAIGDTFVYGGHRTVMDITDRAMGGQLGVLGRLGDRLGDGAFKLQQWITTPFASGSWRGGSFLQRFRR